MGIYFLLVLEAGSPQARCQQLLSSEAFPLGLQVVTLLLPHHMVFPLCTYIPGISPSVLLIRTPVRLESGPSSCLILTYHLFRGSISNTVIFWGTGVRASTYKLWGDTLEPITLQVNGEAEVRTQGGGV